MTQGEKLKVYRGARLVGELDMSDGESFYGFTYAESYLGDPAALPLSASLPLSGRRFLGPLALPFFEGLLPEGDARSAVARQFHASSNNPAQLLRLLGRDCAGDVMVVEEGDPAQPPAHDRYLRLPNGLEGIARDPLREIAGLRAEYRLSLAGAQEKIALYHDDREPLEDGWYIPLDGSPSSHIVKPQTSDRFPHLALNEYLCMKAASLLGIETAEVFLLSAAHPLLVVERFDRKATESRTAEGLRVIERVHQEDVCQALGYRSDEKYESLSSAYVPEAVNLLVSYAERPAEALRKLHGLMLFNYLIGNCDAHLKNYSLTWTGAASVSLAPAYDLVSTAVYDGRFGAKLSRSMGLRVGEHLNIDKVNASDFELLAKELRQPVRQAAVECARLREGLPDALRRAAEQAASSGFGEEAGALADRILFGAKVRMRTFDR